LKESVKPNDTMHSVVPDNPESPDDVDLHFEIRSERLQPRTDTEPTS